MFRLCFQNHGQRQRKSRFNRHLKQYAPGHVPGVVGGCMVCYQVSAQFTFYQHKSALVSTHIKKQNVKAFLVSSGLPFGHGLKYRRFFHTKKEAARYVSYLCGVYKNRIVPFPALPGGQLYLFQEVSK
jgi:hypothetical protein